MKQILWVILLLAAYAANAQTVTVYRGGAAVYSFSSLGDAMPAAIDNDSIVLSADTFWESGITIYKAVIIQGTITGAHRSQIVYRELAFPLPHPITWALKADYPGTIRLKDIIISGFGWTTDGAGLSITKGTTVSVEGRMEFRNCRSTFGLSAPGSGHGGAINNQGILEVKDSTRFIANTAIYGGAIYSDGIVRISGNAQFDSNSADNGVIYMGNWWTVPIRRQLEITGNTRMCHNTANPIYNLSGTIRLSGNVKIDHNYAAGIYAQDSLEISDSVIILGNYSDFGGGINSKGPLNISGNVHIDSNRATVGGGISATGNTCISGNVILAANHAQKKGGAIAIFGGPLNLKDTVLIIENTVDTPFAAAIYSENSNINIKGGQICYNHAIDTNASGLGMAIVTNGAGDTTAAVSVTNTRVFDPSGKGYGQNEIYNTNPALSFTSDSSWWGLSDTTHIFCNIPEDSFRLRSWVIANWSLNGGAPIGSATTFPLTATFTLNDGSPIVPDLFWMLEGHFTATSGSFTPVVAGMLPSNIISTVYNAGLATATVAIRGIVDIDTFNTHPRVAGTGISELQKMETFRVYPNPSDGHFTISNSKGNTQETIHATVYDPSGRILLNTNLQFKANTAQLQLNTLPGTYILQLSDQAGNQQHIRLVVHP